MTKPLTPEQLLEQSRRPAVAFSDEQKQRVFNLMQERSQSKNEPQPVVTTPLTPTRRPWWLWLTALTSAGAIAGLIWWFTLKPLTTPDQIATVNNQNAALTNSNSTNNANNHNQNSNESVHNSNQLNANPVNINSPTNTNTETNSASDDTTEDTIDATPQFATLDPHYNHTELSDFVDHGGGSGYDYSLLQFVGPTLPADTAAAQLYGRPQLSLPELYNLAARLAIPQTDLRVQDSGTVYHHAYASGCGYPLLTDQAQVTPCITLTPQGSIHYTLPTNTPGDGLTLARQYIHSLTGLAPDSLTITDLGVNDEYEQYHEYMLYAPYSLRTDITYRDNGWHVTLEAGQLRSLYGAVLPQMPDQTTLELVPASEAWQRLVLGFKPFDPSSNPHSGRVTFSYGQLNDLFKANAHPVIHVTSFTLEYMMATTATDLALVPVYYVRGIDQTTGLPCEIYVDASRDGTVFHNHTVQLR